MSAIITLGIENLEIERGKSSYFFDHSKLFEKSDKKEVPYYYADKEVIIRMAFCANLRKVKDRLELLGYSLNKCKKLFEFHKEFDEVDEDVSFDEVLEIIKKFNIEKISTKYYQEGYDFGDFGKYVIANEPEFSELSSYVGENYYFLENIDTYVILRMFLEKEENLNYNLIWRYWGNINDGIVSKENIYQELSPSEKYLIVTEGSSDSFILKKSLEILKPHIRDFFTFVDMKEHYPFTGTGNLHRFIQGLVSIGIINKIIVLFDNDSSGIEKYKLTKKLHIPNNMQVLRLPDLNGFDNFRCIGPSGETFENINCKAISIEHFLDLNYHQTEPPIVRWTNFNEITNTYQGSLIKKEKYIKEFSSIRENNSYDFTKLHYLLNEIYNACILIE